MQECSAWQRNILQEGDAACSLAAPVTSSQSQEPTEEEHQPFPASTQHATARQCLVTPQQDSWGCAWPTWGCALLSPDPKAASVQR